MCQCWCFNRTDSNRIIIRELEKVLFFLGNFKKKLYLCNEIKRYMNRIKFKFQGKERTHTFFFGIKPGTNGFSLRDDNGILHDCLLTNNELNIYGLDSDLLEEKSMVEIF